MSSMAFINISCCSNLMSGSLFFCISDSFKNKKDRQEKSGRGFKNHIISDSMAFKYTLTAPRPFVRDDNGAKNTETSF
jgi:hypothetical protein